MTKEKFYITTPIYYSSGNFHLGHCYTTVVCDALARFKRGEGYDVFYLTGTDEHGQKVEQKAKEANKSPKQFVDELYLQIEALWKLLDISYDKFIRTTDDYHVKAVQNIFKKLYDKGELYKDKYEGLYCTPCESFWSESQLVDNKCPDCGREVRLTSEDAYFFRLSKYQDRLVDLYTNNPDFLAPQSRVNEMLNNFIIPGLKDLCVSRTSFKWGVPVPFDENHVVYVWIDALSNYITALGYGSENDSIFKKFWPADIHMVGKEIVRFHSIIWPAILMALEVPLPKQIYGHGWLLFGGDKMSKSKGNITDPFYLCEKYGVDAVRYFLLREISFGSDGLYTNRGFLTRVNSDLVNDLGNLLSRTTAMIEQSFNKELPAPSKLEAEDEDFILAINNLHGAVKDKLESLHIPEALVDIFALIQKANKYIDLTRPWILAKDPPKRERLGTVLYNLAEALRVVAILLSPFLVDAPKQILNCFSTNLPTLFEGEVTYGKLKPGCKVVKIEKPLFPRINIEKELEIMEEKLNLDEQLYNVVLGAGGESKKNSEKERFEKSHSGANSESLSSMPAKKDISEDSHKNKQVEKNTGVNLEAEEISFLDFSKTKFKVGKIIDCEKVKGSKKLLKSVVDLGSEQRTIVSGIAKWYNPEELIGKCVVVVVNLKTAILAGVKSEGMLLCAEDPEDGKVVIISPEVAVSRGSIVS